MERFERNKLLEETVSKMRDKKINRGSSGKIKIKFYKQLGFSYCFLTVREKLSQSNP